MTPQQIVDLISQSGIVGLLVVILVGGHRGWWVFGSHYREVQKERDQWRQFALKSVNTTDKAVTLAEIVAPKDGL